MQRLITLIGLVAGIALANAQSMRPYYWADGGASNAVNYIVHGKTNHYLLPCAEVDSIPIYVQAKATGSTTESLRLLTYRGIDADTIATAPYSTNLLQLNGTTAVNGFYVLETGGASVLKLSVICTNGTHDVTNFFGVARPKAPKRATFSTTR